MATPKPKADSALDEEDYVDLKRTQITLKLRMERRRLLNDVYKDVLAKKEKGRLLSAKSRELTAKKPKFDWEAEPVTPDDFGPFSEAEDV
jgi:hypothetical protein